MVRHFEKILKFKSRFQMLFLKHKNLRRLKINELLPSYKEGNIRIKQNNEKNNKKWSLNS
jgi:hypothetical protein